MKYYDHMGCSTSEAARVAALSRHDKEDSIDGWTFCADELARLEKSSDDALESIRQILTAARVVSICQADGVEYESPSGERFSSAFHAVADAMRWAHIEGGDEEREKAFFDPDAKQEESKR